MQRRAAHGQMVLNHCSPVLGCALCARVTQQAAGGGSPGSLGQNRNPSPLQGSSPPMDRARKRPRMSALQINDAQPLKKAAGSPSADHLTTVAQVESVVRQAAPAATAWLASSVYDHEDSIGSISLGGSANASAVKQVDVPHTSVPTGGGQVRSSGARPTRPRTLRKGEQLRQGLPSNAPREQRHGGAWTIEEETYMNRIIHYFNAGLLESAVSLNSSPTTLCAAHVHTSAPCKIPLARPSLWRCPFTSSLFYLAFHAHHSGGYDAPGPACADARL